MKSRVSQNISPMKSFGFNKFYKKEENLSIDYTRYLHP